MEFRTLEWKTTGPCLFGYTRADDDLRVHYTVGVDTRWHPWAILSPFVSLIDIQTGIAQVSQEASDIRTAVITTRSQNAAGNRYVYLPRGSKLVRWLYDDASGNYTGTVQNTGVTLPETCTRIFYSMAANGTEELTLCYNDASYDVITTVATTAGTDTVNTTPTDKIRIADVCGSDAGVARVLGWGKYAGTVHNKIKQNTLSGSVTMASPNWVERATVSGESVTPTGVNMDGDIIIWETSNGPYYLNSEYSEFRPLFPELPNTRRGTETGSGKWSVMGVISPVQEGVRVITGGESRSIGPETYPNNPGPVIGQCVAFCATPKYGVMNILNNTTGHTWCVAMRPSQAEDNNPFPVSYFTLWNSEFWLNHASWPFGLSSDTENMGMLLSLPPLQLSYDGGSGQGTGFIQAGEAQRASHIFGSVATEAYRFELHHSKPFTSNNLSMGSVGTFMTSGRWLGTTYLGAEGFDKYVQWVEIDTENCNANQTVTVSVQVKRTRMDYTSNDSTVEAGETFHQVGYVIKSDGHHRLEVPPGEIIVGNILKPKVTLATNDKEQSPGFANLSIRVGFDRSRQDGLSPQRVA